MIEKFWKALAPVSLTAPGTTLGKLTVTSTFKFRVKMAATLADPVAPILNLEIKRVNGPTEIEVGPAGTSLSTRTDVSAYGVTSTLYALEQKRNAIPLQEINRAVYEEEPVVAIRTLLVDSWGESYTVSNPLPVVMSGSGSLSKRIAIGFLATDWVSDQMVCIQTGIPTIPGQIGPHNMPLGTYLTATVWRFLGPGYLKEVGLTIIIDPIENITISKAAAVPDFAGVVFIDAY